MSFKYKTVLDLDKSFKSLSFFIENILKINKYYRLNLKIFNDLINNLCLKKINFLNNFLTKILDITDNQKNFISTFYKILYSINIILNYDNNNYDIYLFNNDLDSIIMMNKYPSLYEIEIFIQMKTLYKQKYDIFKKYVKTYIIWTCNKINYTFIIYMYKWYFLYKNCYLIDNLSEKNKNKQIIINLIQQVYTNRLIIKLIEITPKISEKILDNLKSISFLKNQVNDFYDLTDSEYNDIMEIDNHNFHMIFNNFLDQTNKKGINLFSQHMIESMNSLDKLFIGYDNKVIDFPSLK